MATEKAITRDGWFKTGDLACLDEEGFVYIKDRGMFLLLISVLRRVAEIVDGCFSQGYYNKRYENVLNI